MTDIYVKRGDEPVRRRRWPGFFLIGLLVLAGLLAYRYLFLPTTQPSPPAGQSPSLNEAPSSAVATSDRGADQEPLAPASTLDEGLTWLADARREAEAGNLANARQLAFRILDQSTRPSALDGARTLLSRIHIDMALTPREMEEKVDYTIQSGDTLGGLARRFGTTVELIRVSNRLQSSFIRVGDRLRILQGTFSMRISKEQNILDLYLNDRFFKRYDVGTGEFARTPEGDFKITDRIAKPTWWRPDGQAVPFGTTNNVLGTHWLSLDVRGYGIHGTWEPESIGQQASQGCVRLVNQDIEELYTLVPIGVAVTITD